jgi:microcystin-dependent protein
MKDGVKIRKFNASPVQDFHTSNKLYVDNKISIGDLKHSIKSDDHAEWLKCDGRSLNRDDYPELFGVIGTSFGNLSGTTFNLPDARGRVLGSVGTGTGLTARSIGDNVGTETHTLTTAQIPSHTHTGTTDSSGSHTHTSNAVGGTLGLISSDSANTASGGLDSTAGEPNLYTSPAALTINSNGAHSHTFTTGSVGGGASHNIMQPTLFIGNVFILSKSFSY